MIDCKKYNLSADSLELLNYIYSALSPNYLNEIHLCYRNKPFSIEPVNGKIVVLGFDKPVYFSTVDSLLLNFFIDGKAFIECLNEVDYD